MRTSFILLFVLFIGLGLVARAQSTAKEGGTEAAEVTEVTPEEGPPAGIITIVGRMHPSLVHFPIALVLVLALIDVLAVTLRNQALVSSGALIGVLALASFFPAIATGFLRASELAAHGEIAVELPAHRLLMVSAAVFASVAVALRFSKRNQLGGLWRSVYLVLILIAAISVSIGGHLGGKMVFGENYLPF
jgi:uncharacterized membrane protein